MSARRKRGRKSKKKKQNLPAYGVETIVAKRVYRGKTEYLVKWKQLDEKENTWQAEERLDCPKLIDEFEEQSNQQSSISSYNLRSPATAVHHRSDPTSGISEKQSKKTVRPTKRAKVENPLHQVAPKKWMRHMRVTEVIPVTEAIAPTTTHESQHNDEEADSETDEEHDETAADECYDKEDKEEVIPQSTPHAHSVTQPQVLTENSQSDQLSSEAPTAEGGTNRKSPPMTTASPAKLPVSPSKVAGSPSKLIASPSKFPLSPSKHSESPSKLATSSPKKKLANIQFNLLKEIAIPPLPSIAGTATNETKQWYSSQQQKITQMLTSLDAEMKHESDKAAQENQQVKPFPESYPLESVVTEYIPEATPFRVALILFNCLGKFLEGRRTALRWYYQEALAKRSHELACNRCGVEIEVGDAYYQDTTHHPQSSATRLCKVHTSLSRVYIKQCMDQLLKYIGDPTKWLSTPVSTHIPESKASLVDFDDKTPLKLPAFLSFHTNTTMNAPYKQPEETNTVAATTLPDSINSINNNNNNV